MTYISPCVNCENYTGLKGYQMTCKAFPDYIPFDFDDTNAPNHAECNNGYKYKEKETKNIK